MRQSEIQAGASYTDGRSVRRVTRIENRCVVYRLVRAADLLRDETDRYDPIAGFARWARERVG